MQCSASINTHTHIYIYIYIYICPVTHAHTNIYSTGPLKVIPNHAIMMTLWQENASGLLWFPSQRVNVVGLWCFLCFIMDKLVTHCGRDKMDAISQTTFSNAFSWMKIFEFLFKFHWSLFLRVQLTAFVQMMAFFNDGKFTDANMRQSASMS